MDDEQVERQSGLTRRETLKRGAIFGGALVWATPVVQMVGMRPAFAQETSPACDPTTCVVIGNTVLICEPTTPADVACFCCCILGITSFCDECLTDDPCSADITCVVQPVGTTCP